MVFKFQFVELNIAYMAVWFSKEIRRLFLFWRRCSLWTKQITTLDFTRIVPMFADVQTALLQTRRKQMENGFNQCVVDGYSNFVFQNRYGEMLTPHVVNRAIERIIRDCNQTEVERAKQECREPVLLPHFSVHNLRHTFCDIHSAHGFARMRRTWKSFKKSWGIEISRLQWMFTTKQLRNGK